LLYDLLTGLDGIEIRVLCRVKKNPEICSTLHAVTGVICRLISMRWITVFLKLETVVKMLF